MLLNLYRYEVIVDVVPEVKWIPEDGYKNLKIVVEIDKEIDAQTAMEQELRRRHKALGALKIVTDRGLEVNGYFKSVNACTGTWNFTILTAYLMNGSFCWNSLDSFANLNSVQVGDVAVLDISATTIEEDESAAQRIPSAESKGLHRSTPVLW